MAIDVTANSMQHAALRPRRALRLPGGHRRSRLFLLALPLIFFNFAGFLVPLGAMLFRSVDNSLLEEQLGQTGPTLVGWSGHELPASASFSALEADLKRASEERRSAVLAKHLEYEQEGFRQLVLKTTGRLDRATQPTALERLAAIDRRWTEVETWRIIERASHPYTWRNLLAAVDLRLSMAGQIAPALPGSDIHLAILVRTFGIVALVCLTTLVMGLPTAMVMCSVGPTLAGLLTLLVLLPFWTSVLVRTTAWIVLLQSHGVVNSSLSWLNVIAEPLPLMFSRIGVIIVMTHVLLPLMVLPIYNTMRAIPLSYVRAALSLGASPLYALSRVYVPLIKPGIVNGCALVFISAIGYYITPVLVGGPSDQLISYLIAFHTTNTLNWGMASALSILVLLSMGGVYLVTRAIFGSIDLTAGVRP